GEIIDCAVEFNIIKKSGSWFSYDDMKIGQGKDKVKEFLKENAQICDEIEKKVRDEFEKRANNGEEIIPAEEEKKPEEKAEDDFSEFDTDGAE
ncbi:MAG: DNA recombination/repair protein RecA, partial [[Eubacterium] saphenum]|nr:DNA recombination/repair protein RecA [[Eubacterium] saphenum]